MHHPPAYDHGAPALATLNLRYQYGNDAALAFPDLHIPTGRHTLIVGRSGVGKTTLLHLIGGLLRVQHGEVTVGGTGLHTLGQTELDRFRGRYIGVVFQQAHFVNSLTALHNVLAAQHFGKGTTHTAAAMQLLQELGIAHKAHAMVQHLSGGERQRLSVARALASGPKLLLADEPTSSLDDINAEAVHQLLVREADSNGATLVVVTHDARLKSHFDHKVEL